MAALARARGLVVVVSDFRGGRDWEARPALACAPATACMAVEVRDPRELELPPVGDVWMVDPETGRQLVVNTERAPGAHAASLTAAAAEREEVAAALRQAGADHLILSTDGDWLRDLAAHLRRAEHVRHGALVRRRTGSRGRRCLPGLGRKPRHRRRFAVASPCATTSPGPRCRPHAAPPPLPRRCGRMTFREPAVLLGLALLPVAMLAYAAMQRRRRREARGVRQPGADAERRHRRAPAGAATSPRCCCCSRSPR